MSETKRLEASSTPWTLLSDRRAALGRLDEQFEKGQEFHILGAGISGLVAAVEITELNEVRKRSGKPLHQVTIYEGSDRVGGRILTHRVGEPPRAGEPDTRPYVELGAMRIPESHDYTWTYAREGKLQRRKFLNSDRILQVRGTVFRLPRESGSVARAYGLNGDETKIFRNRGAGQLFKDLVVNPELGRLDDEYGSRLSWATAMLVGRIFGSSLERIDKMSHKQVLDEYVAQEKITPGARNLIVDLLYLEDLLDIAFLMTVRNEVVNYGDFLWELCRRVDDHTILGGMDQLTRSLVDRLPPKTILTGKPVRAIHTDEAGNWRVELDGEDRIEKGPRKHLLCTIPFSKLTHGTDLRLVGFSRAKLEAIHGPSYMDATKVGLYSSTRFWEGHGIQAGRSLSDSAQAPSPPANRTTYYSNDHHTPSKIPTVPETSGTHTLYTEPWRDPADCETLDSVQIPKDWVLLSSYSFGRSAQRMEALGSQAARQTQTNLRPVFDDIGGHTEPGDPDKSPLWSWRRYEWTRGAVVLPTSGNVSRYFAQARAPHRGVFFAGCGISFAPGWIQGAAYSALYALEHIQRSALGQGDPER